MSLFILRPNYFAPAMPDVYELPPEETGDEGWLLTGQGAIDEADGAAPEQGWRLAQSKTPLYLQIAHHLEARINAGDFPVGSLLPTENELSAELGVSRQTIRQAIGMLSTQGRLSARKGVGTRVEALADDTRMRFVAQTRSELFEFATETEFVISEREEIAARGRLATELGCRPGRRFVRLAGVRYPASRQRAYSWNEVYVDAQYAIAVKDIQAVRTAIFFLIEEYRGEKIQEILQEIKPTILGAEMAERLGGTAGDLALQISRRYFGSGRRLLEYAIQTLPADRFTHTTTLRAEA